MEEEIYLFASGDIAILFKNANECMINTKQQKSKQKLVEQVSFGVESFSFDEAEKKIFSSNQENYEQYRFISRMKKRIISFLFSETLRNENASYKQASEQFLRKIHAQKAEVPKKKVVNIMFYSASATSILLGKIALANQKGLKVENESIHEETYQKRREYERI